MIQPSNRSAYTSRSPMKKSTQKNVQNEKYQVIKFYLYFNLILMDRKNRCQIKKTGTKSCTITTPVLNPFFTELRYGGWEAGEKLLEVVVWGEMHTNYGNEVIYEIYVSIYLYF